MTLDTIILGVASCVTLGVTIWIVSSIRTLTSELANLRVALAHFEERLAHLPPEVLINRVDVLEREIRELKAATADC